MRESPRKKLVPHSYRTKHVFGLFGKRRKIPARCGRRCFLFLVVAVLLLQRADTKLTYCTSQYKRWVDHAFCRTCHASVGGLTRSTPIDAAPFFFLFFFSFFYSRWRARRRRGRPSCTVRWTRVRSWRWVSCKDVCFGRVCTLAASPGTY